MEALVPPDVLDVGDGDNHTARSYTLLEHAAVKPPLRQPALNSLIDMPEKDVDSGIDRVDAMRISHTTHNSMVQVSYGVLSPSPFSLGRHRTTQTRVLPPSRASTATPSARANGVCQRSPSAASP